MKKLLLTSILCCIGITMAFAQQGFLRGKITDGETGEALIGATVSKAGTTTGAVADFDGNFSLPLDPGMQTVIFQFVSYQTKKVKNIEIKPGEVITLNIPMSGDVAQLAEVVVTAEILKDSEAAILTLQRKSATVLDGVSAQTFRKVGDGNLSGAIKRVTGVSVQGGKYVYVRGLGDRYTRTTLNGMSIPGLDPERNDVQIDIFPTSILENVIVHKTFSPELSGDFTGGLVNVETKNFPEEKSTSISLGVGYNPNMHFKDDFMLYEGGSTDFLGFDDGSRKLPFSEHTEIPGYTSGDPGLEKLTRSFDPQMAVRNRKSFMNTSLSFNHGNQIDRKKSKIGYGIILNYQNKYEYYDNAQYGTYFKDDAQDIYNLDKQNISSGKLGRNNVLWSALLTGAIKTGKHEFGLNLLRTQNGISEAFDRKVVDYEETLQTVHDDILSYSQRSVTNATLSGRHIFDKLKLEWSNAFTLARVYDPDFRYTSIAEIRQLNSSEEVDPEYSIAGGQGGAVRRFYRDLNENDENFRIDATYTLGERNTLKIGGATLLKWREFGIDNYLLKNTSTRMKNKDPDQLLLPGNIWTAESGQGTFVSGNYEAANNYEGRSQVHAAYVMNDIYLTEKLRAIYGVRAEMANMFYTGQNNFGTEVYNDKKTLDELDLLPAVNLVYSVTENINIRASYGRTLARPSFKEKSIAQILDPISGLTFSGNIDLEQTNIDNFDMRLEHFFGHGQMISVSGFYKKFDGHIELARYENAVDEYKPRNIGGSVVYGIELEFRKNLDFINGLSIGSNFSLAKSEVDLMEVIVDDGSGKTEFESRQEQARTGESIDDTRVMAGQAPFLVNGYLNFADNDALTNINLSYNVQGESLSVVGVGQVPDVYVRPFNSLNLNVSRFIGPERKSKITFGVDNILGDTREEFYKNYKASEEIFLSFRPGRNFSVKYSYIF